MVRYILHILALDGAKNQMSNFVCLDEKIKLAKMKGKDRVGKDK